MRLQLPAACSDSGQIQKNPIGQIILVYQCIWGGGGEQASTAPQAKKSVINLYHGLKDAGASKTHGSSCVSEATSRKKNALIGPSSKEKGSLLQVSDT